MGNNFQYMVQVHIQRLFMVKSITCQARKLPKDNHSHANSTKQVQKVLQLFRNTSVNRNKNSFFFLLCRWNDSMDSLTMALHQVNNMELQYIMITRLFNILKKTFSRISPHIQAWCFLECFFSCLIMCQVITSSFKVVPALNNRLLW